MSQIGNSQLGQEYQDCPFEQIPQPFSLQYFYSNQKKVIYLLSSSKQFYSTFSP